MINAYEYKADYNIKSSGQTKHQDQLHNANMKWMQLQELNKADYKIKTNQNWCKCPDNINWEHDDQQHQTVTPMNDQ